MPPTPDWDPGAPSVLSDQQRAYDEMRERCPVAYSDASGWSLFRYDDVLRAANDPGEFSSRTRHRVIPNGLDPPEHTAYRRLLDPFFSPERMAALEPGCREIAIALLSPLLARGVGELVSEFAEPFTRQALCAFAGWPLEEWWRVAGWDSANRRATLTRDAATEAVAAREFGEYVANDLATRRAGLTGGREDLTSSLLAATVDGVSLRDDDIVSILRNITAGSGITAAAFGNVMLYLVENPELQDRLRADPSLLPMAIDEVLRIDDPLITLGPTAKRDIELAPIGSHGALGRTSSHDVKIGGRTIRVGERITLMWASANRDRAAFPEPDAFRLDRDPKANVVFGSGIHHCLGAPLARQRIRVALEELLAATRTISLAGSVPAQRLVYPSNSIRSVLVRFSPR